MKKKKSISASVTVRQCANIKSKKHPDAQCPFTASDGDFCFRHTKNPYRFQEKVPLERKLSNKEVKSIHTIQKFWKKYICFLRRRRQGPSCQYPEISENATDIVTLESVQSIPLLYRWSYADSKKHIWIFDIRGLSMLYSQENNKILTNPYTREPFPPSEHENFQKRCTQLRAHKYCLMHTNDVDLTEEQLWHQTLLDVTMKYDSLGYHITLDWFTKLSSVDYYLFYYELWELWNFKLNLATSLKDKVVPRWNQESCLLFKWLPTQIKNKRDIKWWQKILLEVLNRFVSGPLKEHKTLGALYGMTAFALISPRVREHYSWLVDQGDN
jgi:hypothetical protein